MLVIYAALALVVLAKWPDVVSGRSIGRDFSMIWAAGGLAAQGHPAQAYDTESLAAARQAVLHGPPGYLPWPYPPIFLLAAAALSLLPYGWAQLAWLGATGGGYLAGVRGVLSHPRTILVAIAWPGVMVNVLYSHNGFLSAALLGAGLALLESRPLLAGMFLGAMSYKPHLAALVPVALVAGKHWRALGSAAATVLVLCAASAALFGAEAWMAFAASLARTRSDLETGMSGFFQMVTVFAAVRELGGSIASAWLAQGLVSIAVIAVVIRAWRSAAPVHLKGAVLAAAVPLVSPHGLGYDLVVEAIAAAGLVREALRTGFRPWEQATLLACWLLPAAAPLLAWATGVPVAPVVELALVAVLARRASGFGLAGQQARGVRGSRPESAGG